MLRPGPLQALTEGLVYSVLPYETFAPYVVLTGKTAASIDELADQENEDRNEISRHLPLAFLAPDITEAIFEGRQPADLATMKLLGQGSLSHDWKEQREILGFTT